MLPLFEINLNLFLQFAKIFKDLKIQEFYFSDFLLKINLKEFREQSILFFQIYFPHQQAYQTNIKYNFQIEIQNFCSY
jgi:hypothetical protein